MYSAEGGGGRGLLIPRRSVKYFVIGSNRAYLLKSHLSNTSFFVHSIKMS